MCVGGGGGACFLIIYNGHLDFQDIAIIDLHVNIHISKCILVLGKIKMH